MPAVTALVDLMVDAESKKNIYDASDVQSVLLESVGLLEQCLCHARGSDPL
jgi:hypothetical protein